MEAAPLAKAHEHARAAARATQASDTTVAINEHTLAAGEFAIAAHTTSSAEALRTLRLLEDHHKRLAELLKLPALTTNPQTKTDGNADNGEVDDEKPHDSQSDQKSLEKNIDSRVTNTRQPVSLGLRIAGQIPSLAQPRYPTRNTAAVITNNLNSARGIRTKYSGAPVAPSVSRDPVAGNMEALPRRDIGRSRMQSMLDSEKAGGGERSANGSVPGSPNGDDGYSRFYSAFGSIINRISSPLAFAGLPLGTEEAVITGEQKSHSAIPDPVFKQRGSMPSKGSNAPTIPSRLSEVTPAHPQSSDPDLGKIYSKATVRAMQGLPVNESFYVVPTTGHTVSYATILSYADKEKRRLTASQTSGSIGTGDDADADFVDASEGIGSSIMNSRSQRQIHSEQDFRIIADELRHQNEKLKDAVQTLKKRLHVFEASAQSLTESRIMRPKSPSEGGSLRIPSPAPAGPYVEDNLRRQVAELEQRLAEQLRRTDALENDNEKMQKKLRKYKDQWDALKESAKARRTPQIGADDSSMSSRIV